MLSSDTHLTLLGPGYTATTIAAHMRSLSPDLAISGTARSSEKAKALSQIDISPVRTDLHQPLDLHTTHLLVSVAPPRDGSSVDPTLDIFKNQILALPALRWIGYLSSTNVYGDHQGGWVDETTPPTPSLDRGRYRLRAEAAWQALADERGKSLHIFRLAGIYGPGRSALDTVRSGRARRVIVPGQIFSRIHVADIAQGVAHAAASGLPSRIYNIADDYPAPPQDVIEEAAKLLGQPVPPDLAIEDADLSPMALSFYAECKRVRADRITSELGFSWLYPDYKSGLQALLDAGH